LDNTRTAWPDRCSLVGARQLHFPKLNVTVWFDGSEMVGLEHWGYRRSQWCMRKPPADHPPMPEEVVRLRQQEADQALERFRAEKAAERAAMAAEQATEKRQRARSASSV
jgi:hypothetical protein